MPYASIEDLLKQVARPELAQLCDDYGIRNLDPLALPGAWQAGSYEPGWMISPGQAITMLSESGGATGAVEPAWPATEGETVQDGEVTWRRLATTPVEVLDKAMDDASVEIDGYLGCRYPLPLERTPPILNKYCVDIAIWNLYSRRHDSAPDVRKKRYENAVRFLEKVASGHIRILGPDSKPPPASARVLGYSEPAELSDDRLSRF